MTYRSLHSYIAIVLVLVCSGAAHAATQSKVLIVDLYLNQQPMGDTFVLQDEAGRFFVEQNILDQWQISRPWPTAAEFRGENYYAVEDFPGSTAVLVARDMRLFVSMPPALMPTRTVDLGYRDLPARSDGFGLFMDYRLNWLNYERSDQSSASAILQPVVFGNFGSIAVNAIYRRTANGNSLDGQFGPSGLNVMELTYTRDDPAKLRSLRIGDVFANPGFQGRALRIGGIQLATNFETQPTLITYPLPRFYGETSVPTALDIYVNGQLRRRERVEPGSYVLEDVPVVNGAGQLQVVAIDALGQQQVFTQEFYSSTELLREGLSDYSISIGALREEFGLENFRYGELAASGTWRHGIREDLTIEGHGELTKELGVLGTAAKYVVPAGGTLSAGLGLSNGASGTGSQWHLGFRQQSSLLNYSVNVSGATRKFQLVGNYAPQAKTQVFASAGKSFDRLGVFGMSLVHQSYYDKPKTTIVTANYSRSFRNRLSMTTNLSHISAATDSLVFGLRFSMPFGDRNYTSGGFSGAGGQNSISAEFNRALPLGNGFGYRLGAGALDDRYVDAGATLQTEVGTYVLDVRNRNESGAVWQAGGSGSVAYVSGMTKLTRQIRESFAVVNVGNIEGVRVYSENNEIGRTDSNGQILVPGLQPYTRNSLRIEVADLPLNARVDEVEREAAPYFRSGIVVNFDVSVSNNVLLHAILPDGSPVPEGAYATVNRLNKIFPIGRDGKLFLQGIDRSSLITIRWQGKSCDLDIPSPDGSAVIAKIGDVICEPRPGR